MSLTIDIELAGNKRVDATVGEFTIRTDQSREFGGDQTAPEPYALFLASLGACAGVYVLGFCHKRDLPTDGIRLQQTAHWTEDKKRLERVEIDIIVPSEFPARYHKALVRVAEKCAVKKTILDPPEFSVQTRGGVDRCWGSR